MKRAYTKPDVMFESFSLSASIAGSCEVKTMLPSNSSCGIELGPTTIFVNGVDTCAVKLPNEPTVTANGVCFYNPTENHNLFKS